MWTKWLTMMRKQHSQGNYGMEYIITTSLWVSNQAGAKDRDRMELLDGLSTDTYAYHRNREGLLHWWLYANESTRSIESTGPGCVHPALGNGTSVPEIRISNRERLFILKLGQRKQGITQIEIFFQRQILTFDIISLKFAKPSKHFMSNQTI